MRPRMNIVPRRTTVKARLVKASVFLLAGGLLFFGLFLPVAGSMTQYERHGCREVCKVWWKFVNRSGEPIKIHYELESGRSRSMKLSNGQSRTLRSPSQSCQWKVKGLEDDWIMPDPDRNRAILEIHYCYDAPRYGFLGGYSGPSKFKLDGEGYATREITIQKGRYKTHFKRGFRVCNARYTGDKTDWAEYPVGDR